LVSCGFEVSKDFFAVFGGMKWAAKGKGVVGIAGMEIATTPSRSDLVKVAVDFSPR
jgi:hypothetical protein